MKKFIYAAIGGTMAGVLVTTYVAGPLLAQEGPRTSVYEQLDLFGDIFERIRAQYVEEVDPGELIEAAINTLQALVVDGTQSVGALPFDVGQIQPDALICATYKWLLGPYSLGLSYFGPRFDEGVGDG